MVYYRPAGQAVRARFAGRKNVLHGCPLGDQKIADQPAMTPPEKPLRTHDREPISPGTLAELLHGIAEFLGEHVIGIIAEAFMVQPEVRRRGARAFLMPAATEGFHPV